MAASPQITPLEYEPFVNETIGPGLGQVTGRRQRENKNIQPSIKGAHTTPSELNMAPEHRPSQKESSLPTIISWRIW